MEYKDKNNEGLSKEEQYQRLIQDLKILLEDSDATGIDLMTRVHDLECHVCGAYEDIAPEGCCAVYTQENEITEHETFIIIDANQRVYEKEKKKHVFFTYTFICPVCGLYQTAIEQEEMEEEN